MAAPPVVAAVTVAAVTLAFHASWAVAATTIAPDSVTIVSDPGVTLTAPADGRLRGDHLAAAVTGVAFPSRLGNGSGASVAPRGQRLVVFGLQGAHLARRATIPARRYRR